MSEICVVGPGKRFLQDATYHTYAVADALSTRHETAVVLLRELAPRAMFGGAARVGADLSHLRLTPSVARFDGVDWFWVPSLFGAARFVRREAPDTVLVQLASYMTLHTCVALAAIARRAGAAVVVEHHRVVDPSQVQGASSRRYLQTAMRALVALSDRAIVHRERDRIALQRIHKMPESRIDVVVPGVGRHYDVGSVPARNGPDDACNILFFGSGRREEGLGLLLDAYAMFDAAERARYWLTIIAEPAVADHRSPVRRTPAGPRVTHIARRVSDADVDAHFRGADVVVIPHRTVVGVGAAAIAMSYGLPIVVTRASGLDEMVARSDRAVVVERDEPAELRAAIRFAATLGRGAPIVDRPTDICDAYEEVLKQVARCRATHGRRQHG